MPKKTQEQSTNLFRKGIGIGLIPLVIELVGVAILVIFWTASPVYRVEIFLSIPIIGIACLLYLIEANGLMLLCLVSSTKRQMGAGLLLGLCPAYLLSLIGASLLLIGIKFQLYDKMLWMIVAYLIAGAVPLIIASISKLKEGQHEHAR